MLSRLRPRLDSWDRVGLSGLVASSLLVVACGGGSGSGSEGSDLDDPDHRHKDAGAADSGDAGTTDASTGDAGDAGATDVGASVDGGDGGSGDDAGDGSAVDAGSALFVGTWTVVNADVTAAGFSTLTVNSDGTFRETGRTDGNPESGPYSEPTSIDVGVGFGTPPAGLTGPYLSLTPDPLGSVTWVYGDAIEAADGSTLQMTLYALTLGMGLRWASTPTTILMTREAPLASAPVGAWQAKTTADATAAGFQTLTVGSDATWTETGRTDGETGAGSFTLPPAIDISSDFGDPPAGLHGPYIDVTNYPTDDGEWIYSFAEAADGSALTLTLYAQTFGMGLRWATPTVINLVPVPTVTLPPAPQGSWKTASAADTTAAGFSTLVIGSTGTYTETGRTDGETEAGTYSEPATITIDPDFGNPPAGLHGPYVQLENDPTGDGEWIYNYAESADGSTLTLTLYAQRFGMGLRWAPVTTINLLKN